MNRRLETRWLTNGFGLVDVEIQSQSFLELLERRDGRIRCSALDAIHLVLTRPEQLSELGLRIPVLAAPLDDGSGDFQGQRGILIRVTDLGVLKQATLYILVIHEFLLS